MSIVKTGRTVAAIIAAALAMSVGGIAIANAAEPAPEPAVIYELPATGDVADEQAAIRADEQADRVEATRLAAEAAAAEAARVAAAAAAQAEADRIAAEQRAAEEVEREQAAPAPEAPSNPAPPIDGNGSKYNPNTDSYDHAICEVTAEGVAIPCP